MVSLKFVDLIPETSNLCSSSRVHHEKRHWNELRELALAVLEIFYQHMHALAVDTVVLHNNTRASDNLTRIAFFVHLAETSPSPENLGIANLNEADLVLCTKSLNKLDILS
jgi:hypothetical protein